MKLKLKNVNLKSRTGVYVANLPSGSSSRNAAHLLQSVIRNSPSKFDFGEEENRLRYNSNEPPIYDLSAINSTNIALIYTANDWLNSFKDVQLLKKHLKGICLFVCLQINSFKIILI